MAYVKNERARVMDKYHKGKLSLWKFKMEMVLASLDLWEVIDGSEKIPPSNADPKMLKEYQRCVKRALFIIGLTHGGQLICTNQELQRIDKDVEDPLQHSRHEEFAQHQFCLSQVLDMQHTTRRRLVGPPQQG